METLSQQHCEACREDAPQLTAAELDSVLSQLPDWQLVSDNGVNQLHRLYRFSNFVEALRFANDLGKLAEHEDHHPAMLVEWGKVTVMWWTHKIGGLHRNDAIMAAQTESVFNRL